MAQENLTTKVTEFVLLGLSPNPKWNVFLFLIFLTVYLTTWLGNLTIIFTVVFIHQLHTPMYFLLAVLAVSDISCSTATAVSLLVGLLSKHNTVSYGWCITQVFFFHFTAAASNGLLVLMAVDRYIAIMKPLEYSLRLNRDVCIGLVVGIMLGSFVHSIVQIGILVQLPFCGPNVLDTFYCDVPQVLKLACTDTYIIELLMVSNSGLLLTIIFPALLVSYSIILIKIRTHVAEGKNKAISTCTAQIMVLSLNFGPAMFIYDRPFKVFPGDKIFQVMYTLITPMLNPMIFTLRNTEMKNAIRKLKGQIGSSNAVFKKKVFC